MTPTPNRIASHITSELSESTRFQVNLIQPQYLLYRDTIRAFFYEKKERLESGGKALAYLGISLSTFISLSSSTFNDLWFIKAKYLEFSFGIAFVISLLLFLKHSALYLIYRKELEVNSLTDELARRSAATMSGDQEIRQ
jgi:hypothetical protein